MKSYILLAVLMGLSALSSAGHVDTYLRLLPDYINYETNSTNTTTPSNETTTTPTTTPPTTTLIMSTTTAEPKGTPVYVLTDSTTNVTCLMLQGNITVSFNYVNGSKKAIPMNMTVPRDARVSGTCGSDLDVLVLTWMGGVNEKSLSLNFSKAGSDYSLTYVSYSFSWFGFIASKGGSVTTSNALQTSVGSSYKCADGVTVEFAGDSLIIDDLLVDAFLTSKDTKPEFQSTGTDCSYNGKTDAIVPIAVGIALAVMVIVVLIGYCIGRRRTAAAGYQSMTNA